PSQWPRRLYLRSRSVAHDPKPSRRDLFLSAAAVSIGLAASRSAPAAPDVRPFEFDEVSVADLAERLRSGSQYSRVVTAKYLERLADIDRKGPGSNSVIEVNPDALDIADALDRERRDKGPRGPLHGVPVLIKDNIDTRDKMQTTAGSLALVGAKPAKDSMVARKLREAGAVILGKANLSEW